MSDEGDRDVHRHSRDYLDQLSDISLSRLYLQGMLNQIVDSTAKLMAADACVLLLLGENRRVLFLKASFGFHQQAINSVRLSQGTGISWRIVQERCTMAFSDVADDPSFYLVEESGELAYRSLLGVPILEGEECIGVLYVQNRESHNYHDDEKRELEEISRKVAGSIKAAWFVDNTKERAEALATIKSFAQLVSACDDEKMIFDHLSSYASQLTGSRIQVLWRVNLEGTLVQKHEYRHEEPPPWEPPEPEGLIDHVLQEGSSVRIDDIAREERFTGLELLASRSILCHPMRAQGITIGIICVCDRAALSGYYAFSEEESTALESLCRLASEAIIRAQTHQRLEIALSENVRNVRELSILFQLSMAMQRSLSLDDMLRVILSCVTVGAGLGFNRAVFFAMSEGSGSLKGKIGLGPASGEEANKSWHEPDNIIEQESIDLVQWLLGRDTAAIVDSPFNKSVQRLRFSLKESSVLAMAIRERRSLNIRGRGDLSPADEPLISVLQSEHFAIVPLIARDTPLGAILVDNFISRKPITDADLELLTRFAAPAAWAIDNKKLNERLAHANTEMLGMERQMAHAERLSAVGEIYAEMAHEIKNPLMTIGGFARRLSRKKGEGNSAEYARIIVDEVARLEKLLQTTLDVSKGDLTIHHDRVDLNNVVESAYGLYWRTLEEKGITSSLELEPDLPDIYADEAKLKQIILNLLLNSVEAFDCHRHDIPKKITITTRSITEPAPAVQLLLSDTGGGIPARDAQFALDSFFTTKPRGTGLGLPLCQKIIRLHHGNLEIDNQLGYGVTFRITLPGKLFA